MADKKQRVTAVFRNRAEAEQVLGRLHSLGYTDRDIDVLMSDKTYSTHYRRTDEGKIEAETRSGEGAGIGGAIGTAVGATVGAIAAIGTSLVIPGLGLAVAGPLAAALAGGGAGAVTGGVLGSLIGLGIPRDNAEAYQRALAEGGVVLGVATRRSQDADQIKKLFNDLNGEDVFVNSY